MYSQARDPRRMERNKHIKLKTKRETKMMTTIEPGKSILTDLSFFIYLGQRWSHGEKLLGLKLKRRFRRECVNRENISPSYHPKIKPSPISSVSVGIHKKTPLSEIWIFMAINPALKKEKMKKSTN